MSGERDEMAGPRGFRALLLMIQIILKLVILKLAMVLYWATVARVLWSWFVAPQFGIATPSLCRFLGLSLLVFLYAGSEMTPPAWYFQNMPPSLSELENKPVFPARDPRSILGPRLVPELGPSRVGVLTYPLCALLVGWVLHILGG